MAESSRIGLGSCPVCKSPKAHYTLSKKNLVCVTCNACNFQGFARSDRSDEILRQNIVPASVSEVTPVAAAVQAGRDPEPAPVAQPVIHAPKPEKSGWGLKW